MNDLNGWVSTFNDILRSVNIALCVPSEKCSVSVHSTHFWLTSGKCSVSVHSTHFWLPSGKFSVSVHSTHFWLRSGKCSVSVHSTNFWCTVWKVFCFCAQYTFLITVWKVFCFCAQYTFLTYRLESVLFLCTVHISVVPSEKCSVSVHSTHFWCPMVWYFFK
jgi:hypothetical protein